MHCSWQLPNAQMSFPAQSLLIEHPWAICEGGGVLLLLQLAPAASAATANGRPRIRRVA
jgi:hypothetical protein